GELDWIVMKCLEKDRTRRYDTANSLARDIQRYLNDDPVEACPPSVGYRMRKFVRKHTAALATVSAFAGLLIVGILVSVMLAVRARQAEADAKEQRDAALVNEKKANEASVAAKRESDAAYAANEQLLKAQDSL